ncbi:MAG TPA: hypothetical protein IAA29_11700 [Candidatus Paenibacillus intestinavium]|nr:hypothetical protein [Candidatus Paenibacillus intestinavium]
MAKTNWGMNDTVMPEDMNQIGQEINEHELAIAGATSTPTANKIIMYDGNGDASAKQFKSTAPQGTPPATNVSTTLVPNWNSGFHNGWKIYNTIAELALTDTATVQAIINAMASSSKAIFNVSSANAAALGLTGKSGIIILIKMYTSRVIGNFISNEGEHRIAIISTAGTFNGWKAAALADGIMQEGLNAESVSGYKAAMAGTANTTAIRDASGDLTARRFISNMPTGSAPFAVASTTKVVNLNADMVDGYHLDQDVRTTATPRFEGIDFNRSGNFKTGADLPSTYPKGETIFFCNNATGFPAMYGTVVTIKGHTNEACTQYFYPYNADAPIKYRHALYNADAWLTWRILVSADDSGVVAEIGNLTTLKTTAKTSTVVAINELFQTQETLKLSVSDGKAIVATAIAGKGQPTAANATFQTMATNIGNITQGSGNALPAEVLAGKTFANSNGAQVGTMVNRAGLTLEPALHNSITKVIVNPLATNEGQITFKVPESSMGYVDSTTIGVLNVRGLVRSNIAAGVTVGNSTGIVMTGTFSDDATATAGQILAGSSAYINGLKVLGTMPSNTGNVVAPVVTSPALGTLLAKIPSAGYYSTTAELKLTDADFIPANILAGVNIFGVAGKLEVPETYTATWVKRLTGFGTSIEVTSIAYGANLFVAVGRDGKLATSPDCITWTIQSHPVTTDYFYWVTYANNIFVAVAENGKLITSTNGITWTLRSTTFSTSRIMSITYANSTFVATGGDGKIGTSPLATGSWANRDNGFTSNVTGVAFGNGIWVAVGYSGQLATSTNNGVAWTMQTSGFGSYDITGVTFGNGLFVIVGAGGYIFTSMDGVTWKRQLDHPFAANRIVRVHFLNGLFVALRGATVAFSDNGIKWIERSNLGTSVEYAYFKDGMYMVGTSGGAVYTLGSFLTG